MKKKKKGKKEYKNTKHQWDLFCIKYLEHRRNGAKAALAAGYAESSCRVQASRLLKNDYVKAKIKELEAEMIEEEGMSLRDVLKGLQGEAINPENKGSERILAYREYAKIRGYYEVDNAQKNPYQPESPAPKNPLPNEWQD